MVDHEDTTELLGQTSSATHEAPEAENPTLSDKAKKLARKWAGKLKVILPTGEKSHDILTTFASATVDDTNTGEGTVTNEKMPEENLKGPANTDSIDTKQADDKKERASPARVRQIEQTIIDPDTGKVRKELHFSDYAKAVLQPYQEVEFIGGGNEHLVVRYVGKSGEVVKYQREQGRFYQTSPLETLEMYHLHKILHTILPEHFPDIMTAKSSPSITKMTWEYLEKPNEGQFTEAKSRAHNDYYQVGEEIDQKVMACGIKVGMFNENRIPFDKQKRENFIVDSTGNKQPTTLRSGF